jgi:hypothetical protein
MRSQRSVARSVTCRTVAEEDANICSAPGWSIACWPRCGDDQRRDAQDALDCDHSTASASILSEASRMNIEKITVRITESGKNMEVVVLSKHANRIQVVLGEGVHSVKCELSPTPNRTAFAGKALGREIVYERSPEQVQADLDRIDPALKRSRPR